MLDDTMMHAALEATLQAGAAYAEVRGVSERQSHVAARDGAVETLNSITDAGWGVQVAVQSARGIGWGFASTAQTDSAAVAATAALAVEIARASIAPGTTLDLAALPTTTGSYATPARIDPFAVPLPEQIDLVTTATSRMRAVDPAIVAATASVRMWHTEKVFRNSRGAHLTQTIIETEGNLRAVAQDASGYTYARSFNTMLQGGWEEIQAMDLATDAVRVAREAALLVAAPWVEEGSQVVVAGADFVSLIIHESCGHPTEVDRVLGWEAAFAGAASCCQRCKACSAMARRASPSAPMPPRPRDWARSAGMTRAPLPRNGIWCATASSWITSRTARAPARWAWRRAAAGGRQAGIACRSCGWSTSTSCRIADRSTI